MPLLLSLLAVFSVGFITGDLNAFRKIRHRKPWRCTFGFHRFKRVKTEESKCQDCPLYIPFAVED